MAEIEDTPEALVRWYRSFGDPNGPEYLDLETINNGFELVDAVKQPLSEEETMVGLLRFFGFFPPSTLDYAMTYTRDFVRNPDGYALAWLDGLACGAAVYMMLAAAADTVEP